MQTRSASNTIRLWRQEDVSDMARVEAICHSHPWTRQNFEDAFLAQYVGLVLEEAGELIGYCIAMPVLDEMHLLNITVVPHRQSQGCGHQLWNVLEAQARARGLLTIWLEVRESNHVAMRLYDKMGAQKVGVRKNYYAKSRTERENAILMSKALSPPNSPT